MFDLIRKIDKTFLRRLIGLKSRIPMILGMYWRKYNNYKRTRGAGSICVRKRALGGNF